MGDVDERLVGRVAHAELVAAAEGLRLIEDAQPERVDRAAGAAFSSSARGGAADDDARSRRELPAHLPDHARADGDLRGGRRRVGGLVGLHLRRRGVTVSPIHLLLATLSHWTRSAGSDTRPRAGSAGVVRHMRETMSRLAAAGAPPAPSAAHPADGRRRSPAARRQRRCGARR